MFRFYVNMQNNSSISFTSKISFVDRTAFAMLKKNNLIDYTHQSSNILKADEFYSPGIRTCTGGGLVNPLVEAEGFHFWDDMVNAKKFPQLINVLKGDMSVVGPRPHMLKHTEQYSALIDKYMVRHLVKPGVTGWAQVTGYRGETKTLEQMEGRVKRDVWYIENWSFFLDLKIIVVTLLNMFRGEKNAY